MKVGGKGGGGGFAPSSQTHTAWGVCEDGAVLGL